jgi:hypothetical protein
MAAVDCMEAAEGFTAVEAASTVAEGFTAAEAASTVAADFMGAEGSAAGPGLVVDFAVAAGSVTGQVSTVAAAFAVETAFATEASVAVFVVMASVAVFAEASVATASVAVGAGVDVVGVGEAGVGIGMTGDGDGVGASVWAGAGDGPIGITPDTIPTATRTILGRAMTLIMTRTMTPTTILLLPAFIGIRTTRTQIFRRRTVL